MRGQAATRCIWEALAMGEERAVKNMDLSAFDWHSSHDTFGSPLHAILFGKLIVSHDEESDTNELNNGFDDLINADHAERNARLELLRFAMRSGADPHIVAPKQCDVSRWWGGERGGDSMKPISFAGRSAFECLLAAKRSIKLKTQDPSDDADWTDELKAVDEAVDILSRPCCTSPTVPVHEDVVATWETVLDDSSFADVTIRVVPATSSDSPCRGITNGGGVQDNLEDASLDVVEVRAHSAVLGAASSVLKAMLSTQGMKEGAQRAIEVTDTSVQTVRLLLSLVYTGSIWATGSDEEEPNFATLLQALDLAHRWQLLHVVQLLEQAGARRIDAETFEVAYDVALRLELPKLLSACRSFATAPKMLSKARLAARGNASTVTAAVRADLEALLNFEGDGSAASNAGTGHATKRRRRLL